MWNKKQLISMTLAATATFALTITTLLPRVTQATAEQTAMLITSPTLKVGSCEITAQSTGHEPTNLAANAKAPAGMVYVNSGPTPVIKFTITNPTDSEATVAFTAALATTSGGGGGRRGPMQTERWKEPFNLTLKAGESRDIEVDTKVTLDNAGIAYLRLQADGEKRTISALTFNVTLTPKQQAAQQAAQQVVRTAAEQAARDRTAQGQTPFAQPAQQPTGFLTPVSAANRTDSFNQAGKFSTPSQAGSPNQLNTPASKTNQVRVDSWTLLPTQAPAVQ